MAAGNFKLYGAAGLSIMQNALDPETTARMILVTSAYTPVQSTHSTYADVSASEVAAGGGYSTYGKACVGTLSRSGQVVSLDFPDQSWTSSTIIAKYAVIVEDADNDGTIASGDKLLGYVDLNTGGGSVQTTSASLDVTVNANGAYQVTFG